jgi:hypothetical protein
MRIVNRTVYVDAGPNEDGVADPFPILDAEDLGHSEN